MFGIGNLSHPAYEVLESINQIRNVEAPWYQGIKDYIGQEKFPPGMHKMEIKTLQIMLGRYLILVGYCIEDGLALSILDVWIKGVLKKYKSTQRHLCMACWLSNILETNYES